MEQQIDFLFLADGELTFLTSSLKSKLESDGYLTEKCDIEIKSLTKLVDAPKLFVLDAELLLGRSEARVYLSDFCIQNSCKIVLLGNKSDIFDVGKLMTENILATWFERPINNNEAADKLEKMADLITRQSQRKRILVVDDNPVFLRLIAEWLDNDYNVNVCPSAMAAFHMIDANKPDLILLDYEMPICDGAQFLQMLHGEAATIDIPVMFLTSKDDPETVKSLIALKPQGYLLKNQTKDVTLGLIKDFFLKEQAR